MIDGFCSWKNFLVFQNDRPRWDIFIHFPASHGAMLDDQQGIFWWGLSQTSINQIALQQWVFSLAHSLHLFFCVMKSIVKFSFVAYFQPQFVIIYCSYRNVDMYHDIVLNDQTNYVRVSHIHIIVHSRAPERLDELMDKRRKMDEAILYRNLRRDVEKNNGFSRKMPIKWWEQTTSFFFLDYSVTKAWSLR